MFETQQVMDQFWGNRSMRQNRIEAYLLRVHG